jgi:hypothetical protein
LIELKSSNLFHKNRLLKCAPQLVKFIKTSSENAVIFFFIKYFFILLVCLTDTDSIIDLGIFIGYFLKKKVTEESKL